jgi:site-specific DNA-methyltransferase (adenine-specific)
MSKVKLMQGDNILSLKKLPDNSVDSIVSDPPYGLSFMNKKWDYDVPSVEFWKEVYRVLKPGGHVLSFGGTRTYHRMVVNIEDAGFEIRDQIMWLYGSGFPKSHNIGKAVDKLQGNEREFVRKQTNVAGRNDTLMGDRTDSGAGMFSGVKKELDITKGQSPYEGWGTALKPANEPICVARKPLSENTVAENVLKWGTGGINIDGCRVGSELKPIFNKDNQVEGNTFNVGSNRTGEYTNEGRFPANIILECICDEVIKGEKGEVKKLNRKRKGFMLSGSEDNIQEANSPDNYNDKGDIHTNPMCPCLLLDEQSGVSKSNGKSGIFENEVAGQMYHRHEKPSSNYKQRVYVGDYSDKGGASRFFYQAKVSKQERNMGLDGFEEKVIEGRDEGQDERNVAYKPRPVSQKNTHPTVKPVALMSYLVRLVTPPNGIVLDPFMGSGSTGIAARLEGFRFLGMEMDEEYFKIAEARIENYEKYRKFIK